MMPTRQPVEWSYETWPVSALVQAIRHPIDDAKVAELAASLESGKVLPPIFILIDGSNVIILDGHHRTAAWAVAGIDYVKVLVGRPK